MLVPLEVLLEIADDSKVDFVEKSFFRGVLTLGEASCSDVVRLGTDSDCQIKYIVELVIII